MGWNKQSFMKMRKVSVLRYSDHRSNLQVIHNKKESFTGRQAKTFPLQVNQQLQVVTVLYFK